VPGGGPFGFPGVRWSGRDPRGNTPVGPQKARASPPWGSPGRVAPAPLRGRPPRQGGTLIAGSDVLPDLKAWREPARTLGLAGLLVWERPGWPLWSIEQLRAELGLPDGAPLRYHPARGPHVEWGGTGGGRHPGVPVHPGVARCLATGRRRRSPCGLGPGRVGADPAVLHRRDLRQLPVGRGRHRPFHV